MAGLIHNCDERAYRDQFQKLVELCTLNNLELNVSKTKEIIDFRTTRNIQKSPLVINDSAVEIVDTFKFLGIHISNDFVVWARKSLCEEGTAAGVVYSAAEVLQYFL